MIEQTYIHPVDPETAHYVGGSKFHGVFAFGKGEECEGKIFQFIQNQEDLETAIEDARLKTDKKEVLYVTGVAIDIQRSIKTGHRSFDHRCVGVWKVLTDQKAFGFINDILTRRMSRNV